MEQEFLGDGADGEPAMTMLTSASSGFTAAWFAGPWMVDFGVAVIICDSPPGKTVRGQRLMFNGGLTPNTGRISRGAAVCE